MIVGVLVWCNNNKDIKFDDIKNVNGGCIMKLAEALIVRADYQKRIEQLKKRLVNNAKVQEGDKPAEDPNELLNDVNKIFESLSDIIIRINKTNSLTKFDETRTIADALAERDCIWEKRMLLSNLVDASVIKQDRYSKSEVKFYRTLDIVYIQKQVDNLSKEFRELDTLIQQKNWTIDLV